MTDSNMKSILAFVVFSVDVDHQDQNQQEVEQETSRENVVPARGREHLQTKIKGIVSQYQREYITPTTKIKGIVSQYQREDENTLAKHKGIVSQ
jgi:hypothetical protein